MYVPCEVCKGARYNRETLEVKYKGKSIADVLDMTVDDAVEFFSAIPKIHRKMVTLQEGRSRLYPFRSSRNNPIWW